MAEIKRVRLELKKLEIRLKGLDKEIRNSKGVLQSTLDDRPRLKRERMEAGRLRQLGFSYKEIAVRLGLSNDTMARNRVIQFNKGNL
jgi:hypothetical protein